MEKVLLYSKIGRVRSRAFESSPEIKLGAPFAKSSKKQMFSKIKMSNIMIGVIFTVINVRYTSNSNFRNYFYIFCFILSCNVKAPVYN